MNLASLGARRGAKGLDKGDRPGKNPVASDLFLRPLAFGAGSPLDQPESIVLADGALLVLAALSDASIWRLYVRVKARRLNPDAWGEGQTRTH